MCNLTHVRMYICAYICTCEHMHNKMYVYVNTPLNFSMISTRSVNLFSLATSIGVRPFSSVAFSFAPRATSRLVTSMMRSWILEAVRPCLMFWDDGAENQTSENRICPSKMGTPHTCSTAARQIRSMFRFQVLTVRDLRMCIMLMCC